VQALAVEVASAGDAAPAARELDAVLSELAARVFGAHAVDRAETVAYAMGAIAMAEVPAGARPDLRTADEWLAEARRAAALFAERFDAVGFRASTEFDIAMLLRRQGRIDDARRVLEQALEAFPDAVEMHAWTYAKLADFHRECGQWAEAVDAWERARSALIGEAGEQREQDRVRCFLSGLRGQLELDRGLVDQAARWFHEEQALAEELHDPELQNAVLVHRTNLLIANDNYARLQAEVERALAEEAEHLARYPYLRAQLLIRLGKAHAVEALGDPALASVAVEVLEEALAEPSLVEDERFEGHMALADLRLRAGEYDAARAHLDGASRHLELQRACGGARQPVRKEARLAALHGRLALESGAGAEDLARRLAALRAAYDRFLVQWGSAPERPGGTGFLQFSERQRVVSEAIRLSLAVEGEERGGRASLRHLMDAQRLGTLARTFDAPAGSIERVRAELCGDGAGLLVYFPALERSHLFAVDAAELVHLELPGLDAIDASREELTGLIMQPPAFRQSAAGELDARIAELSELLLPPRARERVRRWSAVTVVGVDLLGYVPFECLTLDDGAALGQELAVDYLPSLPLGLVLAERFDRLPPPGAYDADLWILAAPEHGPGVRERWPELPQLAWSDAHTAQLAGAYDAERVDVRSGPGATLASLEAIDATAARVLQLVTHGVYAEERERPAGLVLTPDAGAAELLWCDAAEELRVSPLVLLSACGAARGPLRRGDDGVAHLGGSFLRAGACAVVLSYAELEYRATMRLMQVFHERLVGHGESPAEALRRARRELAADERFRDPFYHSLIHVTGVGRRAPFERPAGGPRGAREQVPLATLAAVGAAGLVLVALLARRRRDGSGGGAR